MSTYSTFETIVPVRPDDIDMNRHVHGAKYFDYVLAARYDQMERCYRMSMEAFLERGLSWVVKASYMEYKRALGIGDRAVVRTCVASIDGSEVKVEFTIVKETDGKLVARGWFAYVLVKAANGRPQQIPEDIIELYSI